MSARASLSSRATSRDLLCIARSQPLVLYAGSLAAARDDISCCSMIRSRPGRQLHEIVIQSTATDNLGRVDGVSVQSYMCHSHIYETNAYRRAEEGERRVSDPVAAGGGGAAW